MLFFGHIGIAVGIVFVILLFVKAKADYRIVMVGSMLPDIIDKPLGIYIFTQALDSGRIFCHTLLFALILAAISLYFVLARRQNWCAFLSIASIVHIATDQMWRYPDVFYWPLYGFEFGHRAAGNFIISIIRNNYDNVYTYETELFGLVILALFAIYYKLYLPDRLKAFLFHGTLEKPIDISFLVTSAKKKYTNK